MNVITNNKYDAIVVGAGPAGSTAAYLLAASGMRVTLIDKCVFPRNKLCGGVLTGRSKKIFHDVFKRSWDPIIEKISNGATFFNKYDFLNSVDIYPPLFFTSRYTLDAFLVELAKEKGARIVQGNSVSTVHEIENSVIFKNGKRMLADFIIGADGVMSRVANCLFPDSQEINKLALGFETEIPIDQVNEQIIKPEIYFGLVKWGYGWVFPKQNKLTVGVGGLKSLNPNIKEVLLDLLDHRFGISLKNHINAHYFPFGGYRTTPGRKNILLVGDAAGLAEPITGEGISFAMESGKLAAESILKAASSNDPSRAYAEYKIKYDKLTKLLKYANIIKYLVFKKSIAPFFYNAMRRSDNVVLKYKDIMDGEIGYNDYLKLILRKAPKLIFR